MNIKLAENVMPEHKWIMHPEVYGICYMEPRKELAKGCFVSERYIFFDPKNNPAHKLKLIEWLAKMIDIEGKPQNPRDRDVARYIISEAIATGNTEKLISIAEGMLDE